MIYHDRLDKIEVFGTDQNGDKVLPAKYSKANVPCELQPQENERTSDGILIQRYNCFVPLDLLTDLPSGKTEITYRGKLLQREGGFERHVVLGRFHHTEFLVEAIST